MKPVCKQFFHVLDVMPTLRNVAILPGEQCDDVLELSKNSSQREEFHSSRLETWGSMLMKL